MDSPRRNVGRLRYTSELTRAQQTLALIQTITGQEDLTVHKSWRLNERMYGALQGLNKKETVMKSVRGADTHESRRRRGRDVDISPTNRGGAAAATWIFPR